MGGHSGYEKTNFGYGEPRQRSIPMREDHELSRSSASRGDSVRILIVDHHDMFVESLDRVLRDVVDIDVVGMARTHAEALQMAEIVRPNVALIESRLPDGDGISTSVDVRRVSPLTRTILLFDESDSRLAVSAIEAGCLGLLTKEKGISELVSAVRLVNNGNAYLGREILSAVMPANGRAPRTLGSDLTVRELEVLQLMAAGGLGNKEMAARLSVSLHTVRNHVQNVLAKLDTHSKLEAVVVAGRGGLLDRQKRDDERGPRAVADEPANEEC